MSKFIELKVHGRSKIITTWIPRIRLIWATSRILQVADTHYVSVHMIDEVVGTVRVVKDETIRMSKSMPAILSFI